MPANFFTFTDIAQRTHDDEHGRPWPHLALKVRAYEHGGFRVQGDLRDGLEAHHERAATAVAAIQRFCRVRRCTATVTVYTQDNRKIFRVIQIIRASP